MVPFSPYVSLTSTPTVSRLSHWEINPFLLVAPVLNFMKKEDRLILF